MKKEYSWTEDEYMRMKLGITRIPGVISLGRQIFQICLGIAGLFLLLRGIVYVIQVAQALTGEAEGFSALYFVNDLIRCLVFFGLAFLCFYELFLAQKRRVRKYLMNNRTAAAALRTVELDDGIIRLSEPEGSSEWYLNASVTVFWTEEFIYGTTKAKGDMRRILWALPRRIFTEEEIKIFRSRIDEYCAAETARTEQAAVRKADHIVLSMGLGLQLWAFSLNLVSLQALPGRFSFNFWIYSIFLTIPALAAFLYAAIRLYICKKEKPQRRFALINLILTSVAVILWIPIGGSAGFSYCWSAFLVLLSFFQIRVLWLLSADFEDHPRVFKRSLRIIALVFLALGLLAILFFVISLLIAGLTLRTFYENIPGPMTIGPEAKSWPDKFYDCAGHWIESNVAVCGGCLSLLIESAVSAFRERKALLRFGAVLGTGVLFFFCRWCRSPLEFAVWLSLLIVLLFLCLWNVLQTKEKKNSAPFVP